MFEGGNPSLPQTSLSTQKSFRLSLALDIPLESPEALPGVSHVPVVDFFSNYSRLLPWMWPARSPGSPNWELPRQTSKSSNGKEKKKTRICGAVMTTTKMLLCRFPRPSFFISSSMSGTDEVATVRFLVFCVSCLLLSRLKKLFFLSLHLLFLPSIHPLFPSGTNSILVQATVGDREAKGR